MSDSKFFPKEAYFEKKSQVCPNALVFHRKMSDHAKLLILAVNGITSNVPKWTLLQSDIQKRMGWGKDKMQSAIRDCIACGYLKVNQVHHKFTCEKFKKGMFSHNEFEFDIEGSYDIDTKKDKKKTLSSGGSEPKPYKPSTAKPCTANPPLPCSLVEFNLVKEQTKQEDEKQNCSVVVVPSEEQKEKIKILERYSLQEALLHSFLSLPLDHLRNSVLAYEQYVQSETQKGQKVANPIGALRRAILCKWKPNLTKVDKEEQKELKDHEISMLIFHNRTDANNAYNKYKEKFNENFSFHVSENAVTLKYKKGYSALALNDPDFSNILEYYIENAIKQ